jgi:hypothetical protein
VNETAILQLRNTHRCKSNIRGYHVHILEEVFKTNSSPATSSYPSLCLTGTRTAWASKLRLLSTECICSGLILSSSISACENKLWKGVIITRPNGRAVGSLMSMLGPIGDAAVTSPDIIATGAGIGTHLGGSIRMRCWDIVFEGGADVDCRCARLSRICTCRGGI